MDLNQFFIFIGILTFEDTLINLKKLNQFYIIPFHLKA